MGETVTAQPEIIEPQSIEMNLYGHPSIKRLLLNTEAIPAQIGATFTVTVFDVIRETKDSDHGR